MSAKAESRHVLGTTVEIALVGDSERVTEAALWDELWGSVEDFDERFSRFRAESELSRFNKRAGSRQEVSEEFRALLSATLRSAKQSGDILNPLVLPLLQRAGYVDSFHPHEKKQRDDAYKDRQLHAVSEINMTDSFVSIPASAALDLAVIAKGYLGDRLGDVLKKKRLDGFWIALGGDVVAWGRGPEKESWHVEIESATDPEKTVARIESSEGKLLCVATSGTLKRRGMHEGRSWHHLIDPESGKPAETDIVSASVVAENLETADAAASCIVIGGSDRIDNVLN